MSAKPETLSNTSTAELGVDEDGLVVLKLFGGFEYEIDCRKTGLIQAGLPQSALPFIQSLINRGMTDNLILANLCPRRRPTPTEKAALKAAAEKK